MGNQKIVYLVNARLPTEKAHGYQICKMCEAFAQNGIDVVLMHPRRIQSDSKLRGQNVFDYYGVQRIFTVRTLPNLDVVSLNRVIPDKLFAPVFFAHALMWGLYGALVARKEKANCYYTRDSEIAYWLVRLGLPTVYEAHAVPKRGQRWLLRKIAKRPALQLVAVLTSFIKERFVAEGFPEKKVIVLPDGVDLSLFENLPSKEACRQRLSLPSDRPIIGYVGRFRTLALEKGIPELVQAMAYLPSLDGGEPLLLCVGGPMDVVPAYLDLARYHGVPGHRLKFVDRVPNREVAYWIRTFDVAVAPFPNIEHYAYFMSPLKLFEYMASGVPMVATDLPSIREVLEHGKNAYLVKPDDPQALAAGIEALLKDAGLGQRLGRQAASDVEQYVWHERAARIIAKIEQ